MLGRCEFPFCQVLEQHSQSAVEDRARIAVGDHVPQQVLRPPLKKLVHLVDGQPAALEQVFGEQSDIAEAGDDFRRELVQLVGLQQPVVLKLLEEVVDGHNFHESPAGVGDGGGNAPPHQCNA